MHLASSDIKTAFDEAKPKHVAKILDGHDTHGWVIAALLHRCGSCRAAPLLKACGSPTNVATNGHSDSGQCGGGLDEEKK